MRMVFRTNGAKVYQQTIFPINLGIFHHISRNLSSYIAESFIIYHGICELGKIWNTFGKVSTNRAEKIFPKCLLHYLHEIALKYPRERKYSSSFYDSAVVISNRELMTGISVFTLCLERLATGVQSKTFPTAANIILFTQRRHDIAFAMLLL